MVAIVINACHHTLQIPTQVLKAWAPVAAVTILGAALSHPALPYRRMQSTLCSSIPTTSLETSLEDDPTHKDRNKKAEHEEVEDLRKDQSYRICHTYTHTYVHTQNNKMIRNQSLILHRGWCRHIPALQTPTS